MSARIYRLPIAVLFLAAGIALAGQGTSQAAIPSIYVAYTLKCTFAITDDSGKPVTSIAPGTYQLQVTTPGSFSGVDLSGISDMTACKGSAMFQLTGPGVNAQTSLNDGDGSSDTISVTLQPSSTYVAVDNNQPTVARVSFTTTAGGSASTGSATTTTTSGTTGTTTTGTTGSTGTTKVAGTLTGTVTSTGKLTLTYKGKMVTTLAAGLYKFTVADKSSKAGFYVGPQKGAATTVSGVSTVGTATATVNLKTGQWFYYPTTKGQKSGFLVTAAGGLYG